MTPIKGSLLRMAFSLKMGLWAGSKLSPHKVEWVCGLCHKTGPTSFSKFRFKLHGILGNIFIL